MVFVSIPGRKLGGHRSERSGCGEGCSEDPIHFPRLQNPQGSQVGRKADGERRERGRRRLKHGQDFGLASIQNSQHLQLIISASSLIPKMVAVETHSEVPDGFRMGRDADKSLLEVN
ncbi:hypothetical protein CEXT_491091 [Caerostris extrusa]|uniref:Uncharacterized protein n=1 Tax=Caerostris extrusa TaxID=172846 RepID=A0AAV4XVY1_CAEEX|nr:hypothetical protein CEXT_491091 [Caerostris extrusa]